MGAQIIPFIPAATVSSAAATMSSVTAKLALGPNVLNSRCSRLTWCKRSTGYWKPARIVSGALDAPCWKRATSSFISRLLAGWFRCDDCHQQLRRLTAGCHPQCQPDPRCVAPVILASTRPSSILSSPSVSLWPISCKVFPAWRA